ncbi:MAG: RNA polymerase sigma-70 factor [Bacteroidales bacterium]|nr:RNA polymerase sigma-70 factor [Bacteroidales bacterium]
MHKEFEIIFKSYYGPIRAFILRLVKSEDDAEDLVQDVFSQLWIKPDVWQDNPEVDRYIYRMAKYSALSFLRDHSRDVCHGLVDADLDIVERVEGDVGTLDPLIHDEANLLLEMALDKMPPKRREIFSLSRFDGLSHKEIADKLGVSIRTVESHIYSALSSLKSIFID